MAEEHLGLVRSGGLRNEDKNLSSVDMSKMSSTQCRNSMKADAFRNQVVCHGTQQIT